MGIKSPKYSMTHGGSYDYSDESHLVTRPQECLIREQAQQHDETYFLWALSFFMAFNRGHVFRPDLVSETMSIRAFHFIERNITNYYEMMLTDRKEATSWSSRSDACLGGELCGSLWRGAGGASEPQSLE